MTERYPVFWVELLPLVDWRYSFDAPGPCPVHGDRHKAEKLFPGISRGQELPDGRHDATCACGRSFGESEWTGHGEPRWRRHDTGEELRGKLPPGALYEETEPYKEQDGRRCVGADGKCIVCVTPGGHWWIDSRASNCTKKQDIEHRCWVRHGTVGDKIHVDKNGNTCAAGAGSIMCGGWHGFLHNGELYRC
jgi:hypothetical protein